jgi:hypothetical protein
VLVIAELSAVPTTTASPTAEPPSVVGAEEVADRLFVKNARTAAVSPRLLSAAGCEKFEGYAVVSYVSKMVD